MLKKLGAGVCCAVAVGALAFGQDQAPKQEPKGKPETAQVKRGGFPDLVKGLKASPGCIGVETARTSSGKTVIFAWFKDKKAALGWYNSDMHKGLMQGMGGGDGRGLRHITDDGKPVLVIASITPSDKPMIDGVPMPISQISIELYQPLPGGASLGGTFAPSDLEVPHLRRLNADGSDATKPAEKAK